MPKILWINPIGTADYDQSLQKWINTAKRPDTIAKVVSLEKGPFSTEYRYYGALVLTDILHQVKQAENDGYDAAITGCFCDIGLREAREIAEKLVVAGPGESCLHIAASLGHSFSLIVPRKELIAKLYEKVVMKYGFGNQLASYKPLDMGVHDFQESQAETARRIEAVAKEAVENDLAEVIILGCGLQYGFYEVLQDKLGVPVIDAVVAALKHAEMGIELRKRLGWGHSKRYEYESPPAEEIKRWELADQYPGVKGL